MTKTHSHGDPLSQDAKAVRGKALREFHAFLIEEGHDPKQTFCGLQRILTKEGLCLWTTPENFKDVENGKGRQTKHEEELNWKSMPLSQEPFEKKSIGSNPRDKDIIKKLGTEIHAKDIELRKAKNETRKKDAIIKQKEEELTEKETSNFKIVQENALLKRDRDTIIKEVIQEKETVIQSKILQIEEKDRQIYEKDKNLVEKDKHLLEKDKHLVEKDRVLLEMSMVVNKLSHATMVLSRKPSSGCCVSTDATIIPTNDIDTNHVVQQLSMMKR